MTYQFTRHYSRDEARALLPQVRQWLNRLNEHRRSFGKFDQRLGQMLAQGNDLGGKMVNEWITGLSEIKSILQEFQQREIQIKDLEGRLNRTDIRLESFLLAQTHRNQLRWMSPADPQRIASASEYRERHVILAKDDSDYVRDLVSEIVG